MQQPGSLVEHLHGRLRETGLEDVLDAADGGQLSDFTGLAVQDLAGEETPENLRDESGLVVGLSREDLLQVEQVLFSLYTPIINDNLMTYVSIFRPHREL